MVEFRHDRRENRAVLMEINGRYWGTTSMAIQCGIDFPFYEWQLAHGLVPKVEQTYSIGATWRWTAGYVQRLHGLLAPIVDRSQVAHSRLRELAQAASELTTSARGAMASPSDRKPALSELSHTMKQLMIADVKAAVRKVAPKPLLKRIGTYRNLEGEVASSFLKLQTQRMLGLRRDNIARVSVPVRSVVFVCHGNIIRSPMAAALLRKFQRLRRFQY